MVEEKSVILDQGNDKHALKRVIYCLLTVGRKRVILIYIVHQTDKYILNRN